MSTLLVRAVGPSELQPVKKLPPERLAVKVKLSTAARGFNEWSLLRSTKRLLPTAAKSSLALVEVEGDTVPLLMEKSPLVPVQAPRVPTVQFTAEAERAASAALQPTARAAPWRSPFAVIRPKGPRGSMTVEVPHGQGKASQVILGSGVKDNSLVHAKPVGECSPASGLCWSPGGKLALIPGAVAQPDRATVS